MSGVIYLDLKKVFDTVNHAILLKKLNALGVDSDSLLWFKSYAKLRLEFRRDQFSVHCCFMHA